MSQMPRDSTQKRKYVSVFDSAVKVRSKQLEWLKENKDTKTTAGFLDKIINNYKKEI